MCDVSVGDQRWLGVLPDPDDLSPSRGLVTMVPLCCSKSIQYLWWGSQLIYLSRAQRTCLASKPELKQASISQNN